MHDQSSSSASVKTVGRPSSRPAGSQASPRQRVNLPVTSPFEYKRGGRNRQEIFYDVPQRQQQNLQTASGNECGGGTRRTVVVIIVNSENVVRFRSQPGGGESRMNVQTEGELALLDGSRGTSATFLRRDRSLHQASAVVDTAKSQSPLPSILSREIKSKNEGCVC